MSKELYDKAIAGTLGEPNSPQGKVMIGEAGETIVIFDGFMRHGLEVLDICLSKMTPEGERYVQRFRPATGWSEQRGEASNLTFSCALDLAKQGSKVSRVDWGVSGGCVRMVKQNDTTDTSYFTRECTKGTTRPWLPDYGDIFATDWYLVKET